MTQTRTLAFPMIKEQDDSIRDVIQQNGKKLFDFIRNRVREPEDAEDIFQDVLFELTTAYRMMQPIEKIAAWMYRVARNKITDQYRKKRPDLLEDQLKFRSQDDDDQLFLQDLIRSSTLSPDMEFDQAPQPFPVQRTLRVHGRNQRHEASLNHARFPAAKRG